MNSYSEEEYEIFSRLFILKEFSEDNLKKLSNIKIGIVGMGGIGCPLSQYLVNSGIKQLLIVDGDIVEKSNLNRQILFNLNDIGKKKVDVAKYKLKLINTNIRRFADGEIYIEINENILFTKSDYIIEELLKNFDIFFLKVEKKFFPEIGAFHHEKKSLN